MCYEDEKGEVICEGYDEGPRFGQQSPETCVQRYTIELLYVSNIYLYIRPIYLIPYHACAGAGDLAPPISSS